MVDSIVLLFKFKKINELKLLSICGCCNNSLLYKNALSASITYCWRKVGLVVECPTTVPKVMGLNPGGAEIELHVFHKTHIWARVLVDLLTQKSVVESDLAKLYYIVHNRCKINRFK